MHFWILWIRLSNSSKILELFVLIILLLWLLLCYYNYNFYLVIGCFLGYGLVRRLIGPWVDFGFGIAYVMQRQFIGETLSHRFSQSNIHWRGLRKHWAQNRPLCCSHEGHHSRFLCWFSNIVKTADLSVLDIAGN